MAFTQSNHLFQRPHLLQQAQSTPLWDVLVIGGGASGLGIALEAVTRGYKTLLLEQSDFAKGTSSRSTKLVHGGVRYLNQGDIKLVREATIERGLLNRNAPHLVKNLQFVIPVYTHFDQWFYTMGLKIYDWISGGLSLGSSSAISRKETISRIPQVETNKLVGGVLYHDGQFDDARLALNLCQSFIAAGGTALNYTRVEGLIKNNGSIKGVRAKDVETNEALTLEAKVVVNATGVFVDDILRMEDAGKPKSICVSQGVHIVVEPSFYQSQNALMIPKTSDGRVLFAVPWHNKVLLGTTDTQVNAPSLEPIALEKEIDFILDTAGKYLVAKPGREHVLSVFAGLRPLAAPQGDQQKTKEISRSHKIVHTPSGLFTILGGKWTTYRKMGEDMIDIIEKKLKWRKTQSVTAALRLQGFVQQADYRNPLYYYGSDLPLVNVLIAAEPNEILSQKLGIHKGQVIWAVRNEMARTVEDVLSRRTRALLLDAAESLRMAPAVARIMAAELGRDEAWQQQQVREYANIAGHYIL